MVWVGVGLGVRVSLPVWGGGVDAVEVGWASGTVCKHAVGFTLNTWLPASRVLASLLWGVVVWGVGGLSGWVCVPARVLAVCGWGVGVVGCL